MSLINSTAIPSGSTGYEIDQSLRFNDDDSAYLSRTPSTTGNQKTWTWSSWVKRGNLKDVDLFGASQAVGGCGIGFGNVGGNEAVSFFFTAYAVGTQLTTAKFRDTSAWYHIFFVLDSTQSTAADRTKLYINNVLQTFDSSHVSLNAEFHVNLSGKTQFIGLQDGTSRHYDGYVAEVNFIDGAAKAPSDFGETGDYGEWKPIAYSGSYGYGTNGFYLNFATAADMGDDKSGNTNDWTENNIAATDQMLDSPTNNFATLNPLSKAATVGLFSRGKS